MTKMRRVGSVFAGLIMILFSGLTAISAAHAYKLILLVLSYSLILRGIRLLIYYCSMARYMVGGRNVLYRSVILMDIGLFSLSITDIPLVFLVLYLAGMHGFAGIIDIMRALESKREQAPSWKLNLSYGIVNTALACLCLIFLKQTEVAVMIYSAGLLYSGVGRIIQAFRKTAVVYIQ